MSAVSGDKANTIRSILRYRSDEGSDLVFGNRPLASFALLFDQSMRPIVTRQLELDRLKSGELKRIIAAYIDDPALLALRANDIGCLQEFDSVLGGLDLDAIEQQAREFMRVRRNEGGPLYAALAGSPHWGYGAEHTFNIRRYTVPDGNDGSMDDEERRDAAIIRSFPSFIGAKFYKYRGNYGLDENDVRLVFKWAGQEPPDDPLFHLNGYNAPFKRFWNLVCARLAEKTVATYYAGHLNLPIEDCSVMQLGHSDDRWKDFDLWVGRPIDVKSALGHYRNRRQNFVPKFKRTAGVDVAVAGVASSINYSDRYISQIFLGEVTSTDISKTLAAIDNQFPGLRINLNVDDKYLPAWAFDDPFAALDYDVLLEVCSLLADRPESILAAAIAAGKADTLGTYRRLNDAQRAIVDSFCLVISKSAYSKRTIALFAIASFINFVLEGEDPVHFIRFFRKLIALEQLGAYGKEINVGSRYLGRLYESDSGGLSDPLRSIPHLLKLLEEVGAEVVKRQLRFESFQTPSAYILVGRLTSGKKITLYAYCGGRDSRGYSCDTFPLRVGHNDTCGECGKLICHECDHCSEDCRRPRKPKTRKDDD